MIYFIAEKFIEIVTVSLELISINFHLNFIVFIGFRFLKTLWSFRLSIKQYDLIDNVYVGIKNRWLFWKIWFVLTKRRLIRTNKVFRLFYRMFNAISQENLSLDGNRNEKIESDEHVWQQHSVDDYNGNQRISTSKKLYFEWWKYAYLIYDLCLFDKFNRNCDLDLLWNSMSYFIKHCPN